MNVIAKDGFYYSPMLKHLEYTESLIIMDPGNWTLKLEVGMAKKLKFKVALEAVKG